MSYKMTSKELKEAKQHATDYLKKTLKPGDTVYTVLKHVSQSGMMRHISAYIVVEGKIVDISWFVAHFMGWKRAENGGIKIGGAGMDMGFHLVYSLSYTLFRDSVVTAGLEVDGKKDGGYFLNQQWL